MGYAHLAPALLASLPVPALAMVPEQPCGLPVPRKPQSRDPDSTARQMAESLAARSGRSSEMRPDISSGDQCPSRMSLTASERLSGSSMSLGRLSAASSCPPSSVPQARGSGVLQGPASRSA